MAKKIVKFTEEEGQTIQAWNALKEKEIADAQRLANEAVARFNMQLSRIVSKHKETLGAKANLSFDNDGVATTIEWETEDPAPTPTPATPAKESAKDSKSVATK